MNAPRSAPVPSAEQTRMFAEAGEAAGVVERQLAANEAAMDALTARLVALDPSIIFTCARGSSDHAASVAKYLFETRLGIPVLSQAPSISSIYETPLRHMRGQPFILASQSGRSPDLLASAQAAAAAGAFVIALVNDLGSPLAEMAKCVVPLHAGPERSVAATKSFIAALAAFVQIAARWTQDKALAGALDRLPEDLAAAWAADWSPALAPLAKASSLYVLGRGLTLGIAQEAALKCKETCGIHGEAFSIAEVMHGPMALAGPHFPVLALPPQDRGAQGLAAVLARFAARGAPVLCAGAGLAGALALPVAGGLHPVTAPLVMAQSFYRLANALAVQRGLDPDHPPLLRKVTETR